MEVRKRIIITGANRGLGRETANQLKQAGHIVVGIDKSIDHNDFLMIHADLRDPAETKAAVDQAVAQLGGLDILINNAGVLSVQDASESVQVHELDEALQVNLLAPWRVTANAMPYLLQSKGRVINISSLFAFVNAPFIPAYAVSKRALSAYSDILRLQCDGKIEVTTLYPGFIDTAIRDAAASKGLSVSRIVNFVVRGRRLISFEEPIEKAAAGVVRACVVKRALRDKGLTFFGEITRIAARVTPSIVDSIVRWRLKRLSKNGFRVTLDRTRN